MEIIYKPLLEGDIMKEIKWFNFLVEQYNLKFSYQQFEKDKNDWEPMQAYSYYNDSGCFTVYYAEQEGDWDYYFSTIFSHNKKELLGKKMNISKLVDQKTPKWRVSISFNKYNQLLSEIIKEQIEESGEFFVIKVNKKIS